MESVMKVYPTVEEISVINKNPQCSECWAKFNSESNLNLHMNKTHKRIVEINNTKKIYYCPVITCIYHKTSHFKQIKFLKQHYLKVHSEKKFACIKCKKLFPTESICNRHFEYCNVAFKCCECDMSYGSYETLQTHSRRKRHRILQKHAYRSETAPRKTGCDILMRTNDRMILPKPSRTMVIANVMSERQTEKTDQNHQETQTFLAARMPQLTVETQTVGDYFKKKCDPINSLKTAKTQTSIDTHQRVSSTVCTFRDFGMPVACHVGKKSSTTQTNIPAKEASIISPGTSIHTTSTSDISESLDSNYFNMETQTDFIFNDDLFKYSDDYASIWTQTCEELLLGEIGFNDTQTQTIFEEALKSVESQTIMSQSNKFIFGYQDNLINMETQTENHLQQMLEDT